MYINFATRPTVCDDKFGEQRQRVRFLRDADELAGVFSSITKRTESRDVLTRRDLCAFFPLSLRGIQFNFVHKFKIMRAARLI